MKANWITLLVIVGMTYPAWAQDALFNSTSSIAVRAQLAPSEYTTLSNEFSAKINTIKVLEGGSFTKGDVLAVLDCAIQKAELEKSKVVMDAAAKVAKVNKRLNALNSIGELELYLSEAELAKAQADGRMIKTILEKCTIKAPFSGRVVRQYAREKQYSEQGKPILEIASTKSLVVRFLMPSLWLSAVNSQSKISIQIEETGKSYPVRITQIGAQVDPVSRTIDVRGSIDGEYSELLSGMSGVISGLGSAEINNQRKP